MSTQNSTTDLYREYEDRIVLSVEGTYSVPSRTNPDVVYEGIDLERSYCPCPARSNCWHIRVAEIAHAKYQRRGKEHMEEVRRRSAERKKNRISFSSEQVLANLEAMEA